MEDVEGIAYAEGYDWFPEEEIIQYFYNLFSNSDIIKTRIINGVEKKTQFEKDQLLTDLQNLDVRYSCPFLGLKIGPRVDDALTDNSSQIDIDALVIVDTSISASTRVIAEKESLRFKRHLQTLIYKNRYESNLIIIGVKSFILNPDQNSENKEITWRSFIEVKYS